MGINTATGRYKDKHLGPTTLFDKSFIQSLSLDESVWFDHFFITNVCPLFYVETLGDLAKHPPKGRTQQDEVRIIADKFPVTGSAPCPHHADLSLLNLLGDEIPMRGQIPLQSARLVSVDGAPHVISEGSPVAQAFERWQRSDFESIERSVAAAWRNQLSQVDLSQSPPLFKRWKPFQRRCASLEEAYAAARAFVSSRKPSYLRLEICLSLLQIPQRATPQVHARWAKLRYPTISHFAPYAAFQVSVIIFYHMSVQSGLIPPRQHWSLMDVAYLFYLPFCMLFVSSDKLHRTIAPYFLRDDQQFVWGPDLKSSLQELNIYYSQYPENEKERGLNAFAPTPPQKIQTLVSQLWDHHLPRWREEKEASAHDNERPKLQDIKEKIERMRQSPSISPSPGEFHVDDIKGLVIQRRVPKKKGAWYLVPKDLEQA